MFFSLHVLDLNSKDAQPSSDGISTNSSTISAPSNAELPTDELKEALEEEIQMLNQLKVSVKLLQQLIFHCSEIYSSSFTQPFPCFPNTLLF